MTECPIEQYLTAVVRARVEFGAARPSGYHYECIEDYILTRAECHQGRFLTFAEGCYLVAIQDRAASVFGQSEMKQCFANAQKLVAADPGDHLEYVEGYAMHAGCLLPVHHAWVELREAIIDPTPVWGDDGTGCFPGSCYHGAFRANRRDILAHTQRHMSWCSFISNWRDGFPLLRETI